MSSMFALACRQSSVHVVQIVRARPCPSVFVRAIRAAPSRNPKSEIEQAVSGLRRASEQDPLVPGLLTRAWLRFFTGPSTGPDSAQADLDEAWEIAERGPMKLFLADIHLYRARLFFREAVYPWKEAKNRKGELVNNRTPKDDLDDAEFLIKTCGYHRRDQELADAKRVILRP